jgi:uncharacterized protein (TIGR02246 family)
MKQALILFVGISLLISMPVMGDQAEDEAAIRDLVKQMNAAYGKHDAKAMANCLVENFEIWSGETKGRKQVSESWASHKNQVKQLGEIGLIFVTPDTAIHKVRNEYANEEDTWQMLIAWVLVKDNGKWRYAALFARRIEE